MCTSPCITSSWRLLTCTKIENNKKADYARINSPCPLIHEGGVFLSPFLLYNVASVIFPDHRIRRNSINISVALWYGFHIRHTEIDHLILYFPTRNDGAVQIIRCIHVIMSRVQFWGCKINSFVVAYEIVCIEWVFYACSTTC